MEVEHHPVSLTRRPPQGLEIAWSDGEVRGYTFRELQEACSCASCREKRSAKPAAAPGGKAFSPFQILKIEETQPLELVAMRPIGHYAYGLSFSHGCSQGIYTFEALKKLGKPLPPPAGG